jgi:hypothetical protein
MTLVAQRWNNSWHGSAGAAIQRSSGAHREGGLIQGARTGRRSGEDGQALRSPGRTA